MRVLFRTTALAGITMGIGALASGATLAADLKVGFITSLSGPVAALGVPYEKGIRAAMPNIRRSAGARFS